jgi:hypothetical protein
MPTINVSTIKESGGDYSSVGAWESAKQGNMVTADTIEKGEISGTWTSPEGEINFNGWTCDATRYAWVHQTLTQTKLDTTKHYFNRTSNPTNVGLVHFNAINGQFQKFRLTGIQARLNNNATGSKGAYGSNASGTYPFTVIMEGCIGVLDASNGAATYCALWLIGSVQMINCVGYAVNGIATKWTKGFGWVDAKEYNPTVENVIYHCTCVGFGDNSSSSGIYAHDAVDGDDLFAKNCVVQDMTGAGKCYDELDVNSWNSSSRNCLADDTNVPANGSGHLSSKNLTFEDAANQDYRLADTDTDALEAGVDLRSDAEYAVTVDFFGNDRSWTATPDLGAHQLTQPAPTLATGFALRIGIGLY